MSMHVHIIIIIIIIIIAAFIMRTYPSSEDVQGATYLFLPRSLDTISRPHLQCTISTPKGAFLAELPILAFRQIHTQHILHILPGTHLYTWVESSNVDRVSCWRTKVPGIDGNRTRNPLIQSQGFTPIYHGTSTQYYAISESLMRCENSEKIKPWKCTLNASLKKNSTTGLT